MLYSSTCFNEPHLIPNLFMTGYERMLITGHKEIWDVHKITNYFIGRKSYSHFLQINAACGQHSHDFKIAFPNTIKRYKSLQKLSKNFVKYCVHRLNTKSSNLLLLKTLATTSITITTLNGLPETSHQRTFKYNPVARTGDKMVTIVKTNEKVQVVMIL